MCASEIVDFIKNLHLLILPSTLWAVHIDPQQEFIAVIHVNVTLNKVSIDKGILLNTENCSLKTSVFLNDEIVNLPGLTSKIESISELTALVYNLHDIKFCVNSSSGFSKCSKYISANERSEFCDPCAFEVFSNVEDKKLELPEPEQPPNNDSYLDNINFDESVILESNEPEDVVKEEKDRKYLCTVCGKTFNCSSGLENHMLTHAPADDKPFKCVICAKSFAKKYNLNVHYRVHSGERPYVCSKCGKTYSSRSNLSTHMNSAHCEEKRHHCELCEMSFVHPRVLRIHMRKHTGERPFMCQICGKVFSKNIHLTIHTRTHTGEKPYTCSICGKSFTTTGNLSSHKRINHKTINLMTINNKSSDLLIGVDAPSDGLGTN